MQSVVKACDSLPAPANAANTLAQSPVFVVGLPRTGTTLVERILSSHPDMVSGGELNAFPMALLEAGGKSLAAGLDGLDSTLINALNDAGMAKLSSRYLQLANNYVEGAPRFIDKLPFNFLYCGFILHAMPHAKIVHVKRDPFDAAISNFKMLFDRGYEYSYDLADTAHFIAAYEALMQHWKACFPRKSTPWNMKNWWQTSVLKPNNFYSFVSLIGMLTAFTFIVIAALATRPVPVRYENLFIRDR